MTVSNEQLIWLLENDPDFRKQYESIVLAQAYGVQVTQPLQAVQEAPRQTKKRFAGILAVVLCLVFVGGASFATWRYLDVSIVPVKTQGDAVQVLPNALPSVRTVDSTRSTGDIVAPIIPTAPAMAEKVIGEPVLVPTLAPDYAAVISEQAPHAVRSYGAPNQPTPESALNAVLSSAPTEPTGVAVPMPTISAEQAAVIGAQKPHKVR